jgi:hypothetical protein
MFAQVATLLAKPFLSKLPVPTEAKDKITAVSSLLSGGTGEAWLPLARQQATLRIAGRLPSTAARAVSGQATLEGASIPWLEFHWVGDCSLSGCGWHGLRWRFYGNGLINLEAILSKDGSGLDLNDLVGHCIELRERAGMLIGVWSAAFLLRKNTDPLAFQASIVDDHLPLKLHFNELAAEQRGYCFRL